jgi:hypothetical protein
LTKEYTWPLTTRREGAAGGLSATGAAGGGAAGTMAVERRGSPLAGTGLGTGAGSEVGLDAGALAWARRAGSGRYWLTTVQLAPDMRLLT